MKEFKDLMVRLWKEEDGMTTVEIVIVVAVLVAVALIFRGGITGFIKNLMDKFFTDPGDLSTADTTYTPPGFDG